jgi:ATP-dependent Clp protease ATP-binding subunit ClpA/post-segregation antitoxin (ccd killing protein)
VPKINVYLPDDLAEAVREAQLPVSSICQAALEKATREVMALREEDSPPARLRSASGAFARYTPRAARAIDLSWAAAKDLSHNYVGTEHLLLGVIAQGDNVALKVLESLDVEPDDVEAELLGAVGPPSPHANSGDATFTPRAKAALELASAESAKLGHNYIGCEHLLLGLVTERDGLAGKVLRRMSVEPRAARRAVGHVLAGYVNRRHPEDRGPDPALLAQILQRLDAIEARLVD